MEESITLSNVNNMKTETLYFLGYNQTDAFLDAKTETTENLSISKEGTGQYIISGFNAPTNDGRLQIVAPDGIYYDGSGNLQKAWQVTANGEDGTIEINTYQNGVKTDIDFSFYMSVIVYDYSEYTDEELSAITHAQSVLYRKGLKELANTIGGGKKPVNG